MMLRIQSVVPRLVCAAALACLLTANPARAAGPKTPPAEKERQLIAVLQGDAPPADKAIACKRLAIYGTKKAVPALAPLLSDEQFASWARIALEAIPGPAPDQALRQAMGQCRSKLLVGVINSLGYRRDPKAVDALIAKLPDSDAEVASAAAAALGRIGGDHAAQALTDALPTAPAGVRSAVAEGCILCAEGFLAKGKATRAVKLYDTVRQAEVPKERMLEATRGAILARQTAGIPLLIEQLKSQDKALFGIGLRTARELPGPEVTKALADQLPQADPARQPLLLLALAERGDPAAMPTILVAAGSGPKKLRLTAIGVLERNGAPDSLAVLLKCATEDDTELAGAAKAAVTRLPGENVDADLQNRLAQATGKMRPVVIELAGRRGIEAALPALMRYARDAEAPTRHAALQAIGAMGGDRELTDLVKIFQQTQKAADRADLEKALLAISARKGESCVPHLLPLAHSPDRTVRIIALHALASAGGTKALATVKAGVEDNDEEVQDEAVRTLSTWPNTWPEDNAVAEPLLALARSSKKTSHQVLALRGYLQFLQGDKKLSQKDKTAKVKEALPLITRSEEKRLAIAVIHTKPSAEALELLVGFAAEPAVAEDACSAIANAAAKDLAGVSKEERQKALETVVEKSSNEETKKKAEDALKKMQPSEKPAPDKTP